MQEEPIAYIQSKIVIVRSRDSSFSIRMLSEDKSEPAVKFAMSEIDANGRAGTPVRHQSSRTHKCALCMERVTEP